MIILDTCVLSSLAKIDRLDLLHILFRKHFCYITPSILQELNTNKIAGFKFVDNIEKILSFTDVKNKICVLLPKSEELEQAYTIKDTHNLSLVDCECIVLARSRGAILLTDDTKLGNTALEEGISKVYDLKDLLRANIVKGIINGRNELGEIIDILRRKDYYLFSESDLDELFGYII
jgi:predicted nucleic acid-binding protein